MNLLISYRNKFVLNTYNIYNQNYGSDAIYIYNTRLQSDLWFDLVNNNSTIMASCSLDLKIKIKSDIESTTYCCNKIIYKNYITINDVFVREEFRGKHICNALLEHVFKYINSHLYPKYSGVFICVNNDNIAAIKTYEKYFGKEPYYYNELLSVYLLEL